MDSWLTVTAGVFGAAVAFLAFLSQSERAKRNRAEERVEALSRSKDIADETARVMHEIANERDDMLNELKEKHRKEAQVLEAEDEEIVKASSSASRIAGLFNKRRK
jgi:predicted nucleic acid-binding protein